MKRLTVSDGNRTTAVAGCCDTEGGGIYNASGILTVTQSTISGNTAVEGGGIYSDTNLAGTQSTTIENSTISGNTATFRGGGISNYDGRTNITSSTITKNYAPSLYQSGGGGAGVASSADTATKTVVANSIISDNSSNCTDGTTRCDYADHGDVDIFSGSATNSFTSQGYNIIGDSSRVYDNYYHAPRAFTAFNKTSDQTGVTDPKLGPLQDNGGPTQTHALLTGSKAIDKGSTTLATDQRGVSRPQGVGAAPADDVGAFELEVVNAAPVAGGQSVTTSEDVAKKITLTATDADNDPLTYKVSALPTDGTLYKGDATNPANQTNANKVVANAALPGAEVTYVPDANYNNDTTSPAAFSFVANDGTTDGAAATVSVTVTAVNDAPSFTKGDNQMVAEDAGARTIDPWATSLSKGPANEAGQQLSFEVTNNTNTALFSTQPSVAPNGALGFTPAANANGAATVSVKIKDDGGTLDGGVDESAVQTFTITVNAVNDAPVATDDSATTDEDASALIGVKANDTDADGDTLNTTNVSDPANGTAVVDNGKVNYAPAANYNGPDSFTYTVSDGNGESDTATVNLTVTPVNDPPTVTLASGGSCSTSTTGVSGTMNLSLADVDSSGTLTPSATSSNPALVPVKNIKFGGSGANRTVSITPAAKKSGSATITITASDGTANSTTTIQVIVGTDQKETIGGTIGADMIFGQNGDDTINAGEGNDLVCGGNAGGVISGGAGDDTLDGGNGNDVLRGDAGKDIVRGSAGNDTLTGGREADGFDGGSGTDVATDYNAAEGDTRTNIP